MIELMEATPALEARYTEMYLASVGGTERARCAGRDEARKVRKLQSNYCIPVSNTAAGLLVLDNAA
jgi:hypothetical protein